MNTPDSKSPDRESWNAAIGAAIQETFLANDSTCLFAAADIESRSDVTELQEAFGNHRVRCAAVTPGSLVAMGAGAARAGMRTIVELPADASITQAVGHLADHVTTAQYTSAGRVKMPLLIRAVVGHEGAADEMSVASLPGLLAAVPSSPRDAAGLTRAALRSENPVLLLEPLPLLSAIAETPLETNELIPLDRAAVLRRGSDATVVAVGTNVAAAQFAAAELEAEGITIDLIDIRTLAPLDMPTIVQSVTKTGRVLIADMSGSVGGWGAELSARLAAHAFDQLDAPIVRRSGESSIEHPGLTVERLATAIRSIATFKAT